jgi:hypothetical protein
MRYVLKIVLLLGIFFVAIPLTHAQVGKDNLTPLLSSSDQNKVKKIDATFEKGKAVEEKAQALKENEKKYNLKRLEASQYYQSSNNDMINLMKDNIERFWKKNKTASIQPTVKNNEDKAYEMARKARSLRYVAEDLTYPNEKLIKIIEAEEVEKEAIDIFIKVLYTYLNYPIDYNVVSATQPVVNEEKTQPVKPATEKPLKKQSKKEVVEYIPEPQKKDSVPVQQTKFIEKKDTSSLYSIIEVKEDQIDKFNKFLEDSFPNKYENYVINFDKLDYSDVESLKKAWHDYIFVDRPAYEYTPTEVALNDSTANIDIAAVNNNAKKIEGTKSGQSVNKPTNTKTSTGTQKQETFNNPKNTTKTSNLSSGDKNVSDNKTSDIQAGGEKNKDLQTSEDTKSKSLAKESKSTNKQSVNEKSSIKQKTGNDSKFQTDSQLVSNKGSNTENQNITSKGFIYRVQILACRIPIDAKSIESVYNGEQKVQELFEDNWYKYVIGEYSSYTDAKSVKQQVNVPGAFVIAYLNGKRIKILKPTSGFTQYQTDANVNFKVQIAASKKPLSKKYLNNIYLDNNNNVEELLEDEWYKYSISFGPDLNSALKFIESQNIPGAFITSYLGNNKIELKEALKLNKTNNN